MQQQFLSQTSYRAQKILFIWFSALKIKTIQDQLNDSSLNQVYLEICNGSLTTPHTDLQPELVNT